MRDDVKLLISQGLERTIPLSAGSQSVTAFYASRITGRTKAGIAVSRDGMTLVDVKTIASYSSDRQLPTPYETEQGFHSGYIIGARNSGPSSRFCRVLRRNLVQVSPSFLSFRGHCVFLYFSS